MKQIFTTVLTRALPITLALTIAACAAGPEAAPTSPSDDFGSLSLALTGDEVAGAGSIEIDITEQGAESALFSDKFTPGASTVERNFRLPTGVYDIAVRVLNPDGDLIAAGDAPGITVAPGDNPTGITLVPVGEDLGDLLISFNQPPVKISVIAADGNTQQNGLMNITAVMAPTEDFEKNPPTSVFLAGRIVLINAPDGLVKDHTSFSLVADTENPNLFRGTVLADWLGRATMEVTLFADGQVVDTTTKNVIGLPSDETRELGDALAQNISVQSDGTIAPISSLSTPSGFQLNAAGIVLLNQAIDTVNGAVKDENFVVASDLSNVTAALLFATLGYWECVFKVLKCEILTLGCIAAAPAAAVACAAVCEGTLGLACVACITAGAGATVALCDDALACWQEARKQGCVP